MNDLVVDLKGTDCLDLYCPFSKDLFSAINWDEDVGFYFCVSYVEVCHNHVAEVAGLNVPDF